MRVYPYIQQLKKKGYNIIKYKNITLDVLIGQSCSNVYRCYIDKTENLCAKEFISTYYYSIDDMFHLLNFSIV